MSRYPDEEKRNKILEFSLRSFGVKGYKKTTIKDIADEVGIAPGSIYTYYRDKEELFRHAIDTMWNRVAQAARESLEDPRAFSVKFRELLDISLEFLQQSPAILQGMLTVSARRKNLKKNIALLSQAALPLFRQGEKQGDVRRLHPEDQHALFQLHTMIGGILFQLALSQGDNYQKTLTEIRESVYKEYFQT